MKDKKNNNKNKFIATFINTKNEDSKRKRDTVGKIKQKLAWSWEMRRRMFKVGNSRLVVG